MALCLLQAPAILGKQARQAALCLLQAPAISRKQVGVAVDVPHTSAIPTVLSHLIWGPSCQIRIAAQERVLPPAGLPPSTRPIDVAVSRMAMRRLGAAAFGTTLAQAFQSTSSCKAAEAD